MTQFVLLYRNTPDARREAMGSPDKAQQVTKKWRAVRIASGCPIVEQGGSVEVRPVMRFDR